MIFSIKRLFLQNTKHCDITFSSFFSSFHFSIHQFYKGQWTEDTRHGYGVYVWPEQGTYEGYFGHDKKHGYGVFKMNNGDKFEVKHFPHFIKECGLSRKPKERWRC